MILEPDLLSHPKFIRLKSLLGDISLEYLVKLWGHCQRSKKGPFWAGAGDHYVEVVCTGQYRKGVIFKALVECHWIDVVEGGLFIHDWDQYNATLVSRWQRDQKPAQRTAQPPVQTPAQISAQPDAQTPMQGAGQPAAEATERKGQDKIDMTGQDPRAVVPTLDQALAWFRSTGSGYSDEQVRSAFLSLEATRSPEGFWRLGRAVVTDWRSALASRISLWEQRKIAAAPAEESSSPPPPGRAPAKLELMH